MVEPAVPLACAKLSNKMEKLIFETDVKCTSLLETIHVAVKKVKGIYKWQLDLDSTYRLLTIEGKALDYKKIIAELSLHGVGASRLYEE